ncbi:adenosylcobinamide-GDP ribazoletransferase [Thalassobacillus devorans]|uniref:Adenosylcobinamide-GDP ribazoletransferase n=1 Tax=Thalassobacillus devorans TaxID=279813 RepID=A0ABQ1NIX3_9BACI|nr:adenosylcobinamide-GDP ribazoletransferase [Thalassobacillus devorans]NIK27174.1 adenosylcobinamide-GDP ribazoletransferase [Thalassobacillus devorans]GGC75573.1 adenosylcobinamide-GDP ribazoletransferase [Thalassobacillus devorans]
MKGFGYGLVLALQFLTRVPLPVNVPWEKAVLKGALKSFSLVGLIIGFLVMGVSILADGWLPAWFTALLLLSVWTALPGGLHLDGLMDVADAIGSNAPVEKKLTIMKDPHVGSFAMLTLIFYLLWKLALIYGLLTSGIMDDFLTAGMFLLVPACSRFLAILLLRTTPTVKQEGLAFTWQAHLTNRDVIAGLLPIIFIGVFVPDAWFLLAGYGVFFYFLRGWFLTKFHGINGDMLGTAIEGGELWGLMMVYLFILSGTG